MEQSPLHSIIRDEIIFTLQKRIVQKEIEIGRLKEKVRELEEKLKGD